MKPREWTLSDGGSEWYVEGPKPVEPIAEAPFKVVEKSAYDELLARAEKLVEALRFYVNLEQEHYTDPDGKFVDFQWPADQALADWNKK